MLTDSRLKDFLKDARQAVVLAGGVNGQSMPRLMALAQKYGLSEDEQKEAMRLLQNSGKSESAKQKAFRASVEKYLKKKNVLTPCIRRQLIEVATNGKLSEDEANQVIDSVAQELDVPVFSQNDAVEHMTKQIEQMKENGLLTQERLADVYSEAEQWGVSKKEVNQIIRRTTENEPEGEPQKRKKFNPALLSGLIAATVVLLLAGGLAAYYFVNLSKEKEPDHT